MAFKDKLKALRLERGHSQQELAKYTGMSKSAIGMYENGKREPRFETLEIFADFFNVDMNELLDAPMSRYVEFNHEEVQVISKYRQLDADGKMEIKAILDLKLSMKKSTRNAAG